MNTTLFFHVYKTLVVLMNVSCIKAYAFSWEDV